MPQRKFKKAISVDKGNLEDATMGDLHEKVVDRLKFRDELEDLINRHSMENGSNTPDYILADYLLACLVAFDVATVKRADSAGTPPEMAGFND